MPAAVRRNKSRVAREADQGAVSSPLPSGTADATMRSLYPEPNVYESDPVSWMFDRLQAHIWSKQREICESVVQFTNTGVKACHGPGKSYIAARLAAWWLDPLVHELGSAFVVTSAPSWPQVQAILWRELRRAHRQAKLPGRTTLDCHWYMGEGKSDDELIAMGRKPADYNEQAFQGLHAEHILIILDEGSGIPSSLWIAVDSLMTSENSRLLVIGNPDDPSSDFAKKCKRWEKEDDGNVIRISAFDTPAFTGEEVPDQVKRVLVTKRWVEKRKAEWGEESPLYVAKVLGEFPDVSDDYLITPAMLQRAYRLDLPGLARGRYGLDIARMGADKSVMYRNRGGQIRFVAEWAKLNTVQSTKRAQEILDRTPFFKIPVVVDIIGVGAGVYDNLFAMEYEVGGFNGSARPLDPTKFANRRAEVYWNFRKMMENGEIDLDEADEDLAAQLTSIKWWINGAGKVQLESKEDMKERGLPSPDKADAAVQSTVHVGLYESSDSQETKSNAKAETDDLMDRVM